MPDKFDSSLDRLVPRAFARFDRNLKAALPKTAPQLLKFLRGVPTIADPQEVLSGRAFPHFALPYWLSPAGKRGVDAEFHTDMIYSTINGHYSIRLCDNIADDDGPGEVRKFAPCAAYFDSEFIRTYMKYFPESHEFWGLFDGFWAQQAEASTADSLLQDIDAETFELLSSKKFTATKIPLSAVRFRYRESEASFDRWLHFVDCLGGFAQFSNDFFDWFRDSRHGITTYISSEARRRAPNDSVASWFLKEGFDWGAAELQARFNNVRMEADALGNKEILNWTAGRGRTLDRDVVAARAGLELVKTFGRITSGKHPEGGAHG